MKFNINKFVTIFLAAALVVFAVVVTPRFSRATDCSTSALSGNIVSDGSLGGGALAIVTNSADCAFNVSFASVANGSSYDATSMTVGQYESIELHINVPTCGSYMLNLSADGSSLGSQSANANACPTPTPTPNPIPTPTPTPTQNPTPMPTPTPVVTPVTATISANPGSVCQGQSVILSWATGNASQATISGLGAVSIFNGSQVVTPSQTTTYTITATNSSGGSATASTTVAVTGSCGGGGGSIAPVVGISVSPSSICLGQAATVNWNTINAISASIDQFGSVPLSGSRTVYPTQNTTYTITGVGTGGATATSTASVVTTGTCQNYYNPTPPSLTLPGGSNYSYINYSNAPVQNISAPYTPYVAQAPAPIVTGALHVPTGPGDDMFSIAGLGSLLVTGLWYGRRKIAGLVSR